MTSPLYDTIGVGYRHARRPDARIARRLHAGLQDAASVVNIGAGVGSYEPTDRRVVAVERSRVMIGQRPAGSAPVVQARAEALPFADDAFDAAMGVLTIHHWSDVERGLREALRVAKGYVVLLTWMGPYPDFWLLDYIPQIASYDQALFLNEEELSSILGLLRVEPVPIPHDCTDGFMCAYWRRPQAYLDASVRRSISTFSQIQGYEPALARLAEDLQSGQWERQYGDVLARDEMDLGYRIVVAHPDSVS